MRLYSYVVARDHGFAPNPFNGVCTLATCKPVVRKGAKIGDWVVGTGPKTKLNIPGRLIYAMKVTDRLSYNEYWEDVRFQLKKPHMNGGIKQAWGDNIYYLNESTGVWHQEDSHHSYPNGVINPKNLNTDTSQPFVLVSTYFYYFGKKHVLIPQELSAICLPVRSSRGQKCNHNPELVDAFLTWLEGTYSPGYKATPIQFDKFVRFAGAK